jgi:hypoxanthine phosphoribosyltransferase
MCAASKSGRDPESSSKPIVLSSGRSFESLLVPAAEHRRLFLEPDLAGIAFQVALGDLVTYALTKITSRESDTNISVNLGHPYDVLQIMRGGLNFSVDRALFRSYGVNPCVSFVSSQRIFDDMGRPAVNDLNYQKWAIQDNSVLVLADISATGTTISTALDRIVAEYEHEDKKFRYLLVVVVGTPYTESVLRDYNQRLASRWGVFKGTTLVYLERVFSLNDQEDPVLLGHKWGIDFFRKCTPASVESELAVLIRPTLYLERCAIFDGGIRAFQPSMHIEELRAYWLQLRERAEPEVLKRLVAAKTDLYDYAQPYEIWLSRRPWWTGQKVTELNTIYRAGRECLDTLTQLDLRQVCEDRLKSLNP